MAPEPIQVRRFDDYVDALHKAKVVLDRKGARRSSSPTPRTSPSPSGLELIEDEGLLEEVAGLVEWPVVLMGEFEPAFLDLPPEVIRATIRANQKCLVLRDSEGKLANKFILVSNLVAPDGGAAIAAGNASVVRARLADARHFWLTDLAPLPDARDKSRKAARPAPRQTRAGRLSREARHAGRAGRADRGAGARSSRRASSPTRALPRAPPISPKPISRPKWSASSPSCRA